MNLNRRLRSKDALPLLLGIAILGGCGDSGDQNKPSVPPKRAPAPAPTYKPTPSDVIKDAYVDGKRILTLRPKAPEILRQVVQLCDGRNLLQDTTHVRADGEDKYTHKLPTSKELITLIV